LPLRSGFTLVELLVVIGILLTLAALTFAAFRMSSTDKMRSAARVAQSAFLGAKDRALHAKELRGVRLARDSTNTNLVTGFVYIQPVAMQSYTGVTLVVDSAAQTVKLYPSATVGQAWAQQDSTQLSPAGLWSGPVQVRIPSDALTQGNGGSWFPVRSTRTNQPPATSPPFYVNTDANGVYVTIQSSWRTDPVTGVPVLTGPAHVTDPSTTAATTFDVLVGFEALPFHQPISLPSGCVIDLSNSAGGVALWLAEASNGMLDLSFSARGAISGIASGGGPMHFLLRDLRDATALLNPTLVSDVNKLQGDMLVVTVFPQTGLVQTFEIDPSDQFINMPNAANAIWPLIPNSSPVQQNVNGTATSPVPDGIVDDLFHFARIGSAAGR
jgi:prepilin-type N-terminal cleavage/methylation domain-containing protein